ncbi:hypothetical protein CLOP_g15703 [Closterium sp. NIES-67]|nr:hypothetical protein CLOP_g15703 [Closterium sp. NIES-67]
MIRGAQLYAVRWIASTAVDTPADIDRLCAAVSNNLATLIRQHADSFPDELPAGLPPERDHDHKIELEPGAQPAVRTQWRLTQLKLDELRCQLDYLLEIGFVRPSNSPFAAPILFTPKKDGGLRMCIDYRALNRVAIKSRYPIPRADKLIDQLRGAKFFSKIDLQGGYHQIRVNEADCYKTAFWTRYGGYEYTVMPFGLTNAPSTFQLTMNEVFRPLLEKCVIVYLDDIQNYSPTREQHLKDLEAIFSLLQQHRLITKGSKCEFLKQELEFLGHVISIDGGRATGCVRKAQTFPDYTSGSSDCLQPIAYESRKLNPAKRNYPVHDKDLLAIVHAFKVWRCYLTGADVTVRTNHKSLKFIRAKPTLNSRQIRWLDYLESNFHYRVTYKRGVSNIADALTRPSVHTCAQQVTMDFVTGLPAGPSGNDAILVVIDRLTKMAHFAACKTTITAEQTTKLFLTNIVRLHGLPSAIISDHDPRFTSSFWTKIWEQYDTRLHLSTAYDPQTDDQTELINKTMEQLIRTTCTDPTQWEDSLPLIKFAYNNASLSMTAESPFSLNYGLNPTTPTTPLVKSFVRPSTSPFAAPIMSTPKKDDGLRMCIDYRALNRVTIKSRYPIPRADELIDQLRGAKLFSKIDRRGSYHQIRISDMCEFLKHELEFLGHVISVDGVKIDQKKIATIQDWKPPADLRELQNFMGFVNYVRRFIPNMVGLTSPLTDLLKRGKYYEWGGEQQAAFEQLKLFMTTPPVLRIADSHRPFELITDANDLAVGAVLLQDFGEGLQPIAYELRKLNPAERNYPVHDKELLAIVHAFNVWRCYLTGVHVTIRTDHKSL